jgi:serine protease Do
MIKKYLAKTLKVLFFLGLFFIFSGFAGIVGDRFVMPWLSSKDFLQKLSFFKRANEKVTVINKTEQVVVKEDYSVASVAQGIAPAVVSIIDLEGNQTGQTQGENFSAIKTSVDLQKKVRTGLAITSDGLVMSVMKSHEIANPEALIGKKAKILANDGREFEAQVLDIDLFSNLIFFKANSSNFPSPVFGNSDDLEIGEKIIVTGNAGGEYQNTFSTGIIKEKDKTFTLLNSELSSSEKTEGAIISSNQIDNSNIGGPAIDFNGQIVGIVNQVEKDGENIGFIMPINRIKGIIDREIRGEKIQRPVLGLYYLSINKEISLLNNLPVSQGALVYSFSGQQGLAVIKNSPADLAGIKLEDIVIEVSGTKVDLDHPLSDIIAGYSKGDKINLKILRDSKEIEIPVELK